MALVCSMGAYEHDWCTPGKRSSALTAPVLGCTTVGYTWELEKGKVRGAKPILLPWTAAAAQRWFSLNNSEALRLFAAWRGKYHCGRSHWLDSFDAREVTG